MFKKKGGGVYLTGFWRVLIHVLVYYVLWNEAMSVSTLKDRGKNLSYLNI